MSNNTGLKKRSGLVINAIEFSAIDLAVDVELRVSA